VEHRDHQRHLRLTGRALVASTSRAISQAAQKTRLMEASGSSNSSMKTAIARVVWAGVALAPLCLASCTGRIGAAPGDSPASAAMGGGGSAATGGGSATSGGGTGTPGSVGIHRLNAFEYDNTINDLLGLSQSTAQKTFVPDETGVNGFDNEADALTMTDAEFQQYFNAADTLTEQAFADPALAKAVVTCTPASATDAACLDAVINGFGLRAYRRPLTAAEVTRARTLAADAVTNGQDFNGQVKQIVKMMLSSAPFLYRIEVDAAPASQAVHRLSAYELATRLSYLVWSSMPDAKLFAQAQTGALTTDATLGLELARLLQDPRAAGFTSSFAGQWLGVRALAAHQVEPTAFPRWSEPVRQAMVQEVQLYFNEFLTGSLPWTQFLTAPISFVNGPLAALYGVKDVPATQTTMTKVMNADPNRVGFLGTGAFLTQSSYSYRTVPTLRGKWVYENLLGEKIPAPPAGVPALDPAQAAATDSMTQEENVRARLVAHRAEATCAACHNTLDPIGLGLENFDGVGTYRSAYGNGQTIDASGMLPDGTTFNGLPQLAAILSQGTRQQEMLGFAVQQLMTYALGRPLGAGDMASVAQIQQQWATQGYAFKALLQDVVLSETFRSRHGGA
jgi:uncharacterized protein DUF1592/uncharacterized protein DUF1588/uncharacterized protein DUF1587/uncharacterized protein DUF1585/uncharacterized protein DUF1595